MENVLMSPTPLIARSARSLVWSGMGVILWAGLCLRNPRLRALVLTLPAA